MHKQPAWGFPGARNLGADRPAHRSSLTRSAVNSKETATGYAVQFTTNQIVDKLFNKSKNQCGAKMDFSKQITCTLNRKRNRHKSYSQTPTIHLRQMHASKRQPCFQIIGLISNVPPVHNALKADRKIHEVWTIINWIKDKFIPKAHIRQKWYLNFKRWQARSKILNTLHWKLEKHLTDQNKM